jgi:hypothetical protein
MFLIVKYLLITAKAAGTRLSGHHSRFGPGAMLRNFTNIPDLPIGFRPLLIHVTTPELSHFQVL